MESVHPQKPIETIRATAVNIGQFTIKHLVGGAWGDTANAMNLPVKPNVTKF